MHTTRKMIVKAARRMFRAISFGVFCRFAPSMSLIIRSRKPPPGSAVTRTTSQSERTFVPPVTALRSPPDSRITGALSPVMALSSTEAIPSITSPSAGMISPVSTRITSSFFSVGRSDCRDSAFSSTCVFKEFGRRVPARLAQRLRLRLAPSFGDGFGEIRKKDGEPEPERDGADEPGRSFPVSRPVPESRGRSSARFPLQPRT